MTRTNQNSWRDLKAKWCVSTNHVIFLKLKVTQNEIYYHFGAACQWQFEVVVHPGVLMCSHYIQSFDFQNRDTVALAQFAEHFISTHPPLPEINDYPFENMWWTCLPHATFLSPTV